MGEGGLDFVALKQHIHSVVTNRWKVDGSNLAKCLAKEGTRLCQRTRLP